MAIKAQIAKTVAPRIAAACLTISAAGFGAWMTHEGFREKPYIPTKGDVPTIGYGSTRYEDGTRVKMTDPPITRDRAAELARSLMSLDEQMFRSSIPGVELYQHEYDAYVDFIGQYGIGNWYTSSMRRNLREGQYRAACDSLLLWRRQGGRNCSLPENWGPQGCLGVWTRQIERHKKCLGDT